jgi:parvulin-like peptidyl-prolyl isomerase
MFSEDQMSASAGGDLGCTPIGAFGPGIAEAIWKLPAGALSPVLASPWGYHIIKTYPVSDNDIAALLKEEFLQSESRRLNDEIKRGARVEQKGPSQE